MGRSVKPVITEAETRTFAHHEAWKFIAEYKTASEHNVLHPKSRRPV
jgi:hypothetical protein